MYGMPQVFHDKHFMNLSRVEFIHLQYVYKNMWGDGFPIIKLGHKIYIVILVYGSLKQKKIF